MNNLNFILVFLYQSIITFTIYIFFSNLLVLNNKKLAFIFYIFFYVTSCIYCLFDFPAKSTLLVNGILLLTISFCYKGSFLWKLSSSLFLFLLILFTGSLLPIISTRFISINTAMHFSNIYSNLLIFGCVLVLIKVKKAFGNGYLSKKYWLSILLTPTISILIIFLLLKSIIINDYPYIFPMAILLLLIINILIFLLCDYTIALHNVQILKMTFENQSVYYLNQYKMMERIQKEHSKIQHDIKNVLIGYSNAQQDIDDLDYWIKSEMKTHAIITGNVTIDSILNYKSNEAKKMNIEMILDLNIPNHINLDIPTISIILGNLIDNALESCNLNSDLNQRKIFIKINYINHNIYIKIKNYYSHTLRRKSEDSFYSTKFNNKNHGIGIENVKKVVDKMNGVISISTENREFCVEVLIYVKD